jgi:hypothetical protein
VLCGQQVFTEQGVSIEFSIASKPVAGEEATVLFKITDVTGKLKRRTFVAVKIAPGMVRCLEWSLWANAPGRR